MTTIPVTDLEAAAAFYAATLGYPLEHENVTLVQASRPASSGVVYLATNDVERCLTRAHAAGARIVQGKTEIVPFGTIALIADPDGNIIGLHREPTR